MSPFQLAWSNLVHQRFRTLISLIGVGFAVLLVFMQIGFLDAVRRTATLLYDEFAFDLLLTSTEYNHLGRPSSFSRDRIVQARGVPGVRDVLPVTVSLGLWRDPLPAPPGPDRPRRQWSILTLAFPPARADEVFLRPEGRVFPTREDMDRGMALLARTGAVLIDRSSRKEYGNPDTWQAGARNELNGRPVEVVGTFRIGTGFGYNGLLMASEETLARAGWPGNRVSFGLVQLDPDADREAVRRGLVTSLPEDVHVYTRGAMNDKERTFWLTGTPVGQFFIVGVVIALLVGSIFVYQMMSSDITKNLPEYATILALGYPGRFLSRVVYWQGLLLGLVGFVPGFLVSFVSYEIIRRNVGLPITMTSLRTVLVLVLTLVMCMGSAAAAVRVVHRANPADLF